MFSDTILLLYQVSDVARVYNEVYEDWGETKPWEDLSETEQSFICNIFKDQLQREFNKIDEDLIMDFALKQMEKEA